MPKPFHILSLALLLLALTLPLSTAQARTLSLPRFQDASAAPEATDSTPMSFALSPAEVINAVNSLRAANGLNILSVDPVLMQVAAQQASVLARLRGRNRTSTPLRHDAWTAAAHDGLSAVG